MVCDSGENIIIGENKDVLILILLEYGLRLRLTDVNGTPLRVLILILLEYGLRPH